MLDVAGNNLANVNTTAFKSSRITFSELLSETIKKASQPTTEVGGTNPQQMGSGVGVAGISPNMTQGNIVNTGNPLDLALEGEGYFVLSDGSQNLYTRAGAFGVDAGSSLIDPTLVDPATGYRVQRVGDVGEADDFQVTGNSNIRVPYGVTLGANATSAITVQGNLSANATATAQKQKMTANLKYTTGGGTTAVATDEIDQLDQFSWGSGSGGQLGATESGTITFSGYKPDGTALTSAPETDLEMDVTGDTTLQDVLDWLSTDDGMSNEKQTLSQDTGTSSAGTFNVAFGGDNVDIAYDAPATGTNSVKEKLESLSSIDVGDVIVTGGALPGTAIVVEFTGQYSGTDVADMVIDNDNLEGGTIKTTETKQGTKAINEKQTVTITGTPTGGSFTLDFGTGTPATVAFGADAAAVKTALVTLDGITTNDVNVTGGALPGTPVVIEFIGALDGTDVNMLTIDTTLLEGGTDPAGSVAETVKGRGLQGILGADATATLVNGKIVLTDAVGGYSQTDLTMTYAAAGSETHSLEVPAYFEMTTVGGEEVKNVSITVYDSLGGKHVLSGAFVRVEETGTLNTWDMVLTSVTGDINGITMDNRRIKDIEFDANDGSYKGLNATTGDDSEFVVTFAHDPTNPQTIGISMGTIGKFDGLTQLAGNSTAVAREQDGYESGTLATVSVDNEGIVIGSFSNGIKMELATIQITLFKNPAALENIGGGYFTASANSGTAVETQAMSAGAGTVHGGALEKSNADVATEFVNMIKAQNGFQANARTIRVANDILRELTNLIR